ncbi:endo alpha-1,4 polygalactosaminidase [Sphingomonas sp. LR55]|uniref:endo alpha-1,4 polygalactosaminidase n=1 Tax=Sphingomonas sp. LR55 TaxID=3050231 RepID=UPI002FDFC9AE
MTGSDDMARRTILQRVLAMGAIGLTIGARSRSQATPKPSPDTVLRWGIDYGATTDPVLARACALLVLEPHHARPIAPLRGPGSILLGYVSFGEVERGRPYFAALDKAGALSAANPNWPDARLADLRHPAWRAAVLDRLVPAILALGYDGIFIDTMDNAEAMERQDPVANTGMVAAGATLIAAVRARFPKFASCSTAATRCCPTSRPRSIICLARRWRRGGISLPNAMNCSASRTGRGKRVACAPREPEPGTGVDDARLLESCRYDADRGAICA